MFELNFIAKPGIQKEYIEVSWSFLQKSTHSETESDPKSSVVESKIYETHWKDYGIIAFAVIIFAVISMFDSIREWNRKNIPNYVEIYIKSDIEKIIKTGKKRTYKDFKTNIVGLDITPELPKSPNIIIENNFKKNIVQLSSELLKKIKSTIQ